MKIKNHLPLIVGYTVIVTAFIMLIVPAYFYLFEDNPPAEIHSITFMADTVTAGDESTVKVSLCRFTDAPVTVRRAWINGLRHVEPAIRPPALDVGCSDNVPLDITIPAELPPGDYRLEWEFIYDVNHLTTRSVKYTTDFVKVIE